jgi:hypothetical protein
MADRPIIFGTLMGIGLVLPAFVVVLRGQEISLFVVALGAPLALGLVIVALLLLGLLGADVADATQDRPAPSNPPTLSGHSTPIQAAGVDDREGKDFSSFRHPRYEAREIPVPVEVPPIDDRQADRHGAVTEAPLAEPLPVEHVPPPAPPPPRWEDIVDPSLRPLVRDLSSDLPFRVADAARALGKTGHPDAVGPLIRILRVEQRSVRFAVVEALWALGPLSVGPLKEALAKAHELELKPLLVLVLEESERRAAGLEPKPTAELLEMSAEMLDSFADDLTR